MNASEIARLTQNAPVCTRFVPSLVQITSVPLAMDLRFKRKWTICLWLRFHENVLHNISIFITLALSSRFWHKIIDFCSLSLQNRKSMSWECRTENLSDLSDMHTTPDWSSRETVLDYHIANLDLLQICVQGPCVCHPTFLFSWGKHFKLLPELLLERRKQRFHIRSFQKWLS
jgi:hypothetical protein